MTDRKGVLKATAAVRTIGMDYVWQGPESVAPLTRDEAFSKIVKGGNMDAKEVNAVLDNLCDKIGTTADKLVPEFAGYYIARNCAWIILGLAVLSLSLYCLIRAVKMSRATNEELRLTRSYMDKVLNGEDPGAPQYFNSKFVYYDDTDIGIYGVCSGISGIISLWLLIEGITRIIGWTLSPYAMTVMWIINQIGGGQ